MPARQSGQLDIWLLVAATAILVLGAASWGALLDGVAHCYDKA